MTGGEIWPKPDQRATPEDFDRARHATDFDLLAKVARDSGCTMEEAARVLNRLRSAGLEGATTITYGGAPYIVATEQGGPCRPRPLPKLPRVPWYIWLAARLVNVLKSFGIGTDTKGAKG